MNLLIKGMAAPQSCYMCDIIELSGAISCPHTNKPNNSDWGRALDCPLVEITKYDDSNRSIYQTIYGFYNGVATNYES